LRAYRTEIADNTTIALIRCKKPNTTQERAASLFDFGNKNGRQLGQLNINNCSIICNFTPPFSDKYFGRGQIFKRQPNVYFLNEEFANRYEFGSFNSIKHRGDWMQKKMTGWNWINCNEINNLSVNS